MTALGDALTSWGAVYVALSLPAVLMLANFVFGRCFISEALCRAQHAPHQVHTKSRIVDRAHVACVVVSFAWQYYVVMFQARTEAGDRVDPRACNPAYFVWDLIDRLPSLRGLQMTLLFQCNLADAAYLILLALFAFSFASCVCSVPQISPGSGNDDLNGSSYCRRCGSHVHHMDHHCSFIGNCVGGCNRRTFVWCLLTGVANLSFLLYNYTVWVFTDGNIVTIVGALLVMVFDLFLIALLAFQWLLCWRGWTTREFLHRRRQNRESLVRSLLRLSFQAPLGTESLRRTPADLQKPVTNGH